MIVPYFRLPDRKLKLLANANSWLGTPFAARSMVKGSGVDCVHLAAALLIECGHWSTFDPIRYTLDGAKHLETSQVETFARQCGSFQERDFLSYAPQPGDVLTFKMGRVSHHVGTMIDHNRFIHVHQKKPTSFNDIRDATWSVRINNVFVPVETV